MRYTVVCSKIDIIGRLWQPGFTGAMSHTLPDQAKYVKGRQYVTKAASEYTTADDLTRGTGTITRETIEDWVNVNSGDFAEVLDFRASVAVGDEDIIIDWADPESEAIFADCEGWD
jgi:hypothetical protein